jgi:hypothetical protein
VSFSSFSSLAEKSKIKALSVPLDGLDIFGNLICEGQSG